MKRLAENYLVSWLKEDNRKPLVLRGARQVGKSTLVRMFAQSQKLKLVEVNLEKRKLKSVKNDEISIESILAELQALFEIDIGPDALLFFDEIQAQPEILTCLRYFYEERNDIPVIGAGSLLEFTLEDHQFSMPVGRIEYFHLGPMTFHEYLIARNKTKLLEQIKKNPTLASQQHHDLLTELLKEYLYVGGMPAAVAEFIKSNNPAKVKSIHRSIIRTYQDDFPKYARKPHLQNIQTVFERLPQFIGKKLKYSEFLSDLQSREIKTCLRLLQKARVILTCFHSNCSGLPLNSQKDENVFKLYFLDIGLLNYLSGISWNQTQSYNEDSLLTKGEIAEQFAAQHLAYQDQGLEEPKLYYWLRDKKSHNAEVDFVTTMNNQIIAIEIKAGSSKKLLSAVQFSKEKDCSLIYRFDLSEHQTPTQKIQIHATKISTISNAHLSLIDFFIR